MQIDHTALIKERLSIADVVGSYVRLERAGANYKAPCPFHNEKTPSFFVVPEKGIYHCFGCGRGGDIFTFVEEIEGVDFRGALTMLAERAGVELTAQSRTEKGKYDRLYHALELATRFFEVNLRKDPEVVEYLISRGLTKDTIKSFRIGYVDNEWQGLYNRLRATGITEEELLAVGLVIKKESRAFDRFRNRIMFPLADSQGRIIGFSGRTFDVRKGEGEMAKYMNSPETVLYHKGTMLFGYDRAKKAMRDNDQCLLVEGQFDVVLAHQAGTTNAVALSGTGLTADHCALIRRFTDNLVLALDGDDAGMKASRRSVLLGLREGLRVSVLPLPAGDDPASMIARDPVAWQQSVQNDVRPVFELELANLEREPEATQRNFVSDTIFPLLQSQQSSIVQDKSMGKVAHVLGVSTEALRKDFAVWDAQHPIVVGEANRPNAGLKNGENQARGETGSETKMQELFLGLMQLLAEKNEPLYADMERSFDAFAGQNAFQTLRSQFAAKLPEWSFVAEHALGTEPDQLAKAGNELLTQLEHRVLSKQMNELLTRANRAERSGDTQQHAELLQALQKVTRRLSELRDMRSHY